MSNVIDILFEEYDFVEEVQHAISNISIYTDAVVDYLLNNVVEDSQELEEGEKKEFYDRIAILVEELR